VIPSILYGVAALLALAQTTWFSGLNIAGARPDFVLVVLTYAAHIQGTQRGQIGGFAIGFLEDALSISPIGFHALVRLAHTAVLGLTYETVRLDALLTPSLLVSIALIIKYVVAALLAAILPAAISISPVWSVSTAVEFGLTIVSAPILFATLRPVVGRFAGARQPY
jgi:rod shape-determining protein MreD